MYALVVVCARLIVPTFSDKPAAAAALVLAYVALYVLSAGSHLRCMLTNPGKRAHVGAI